jgi:hypothetical protein
VNGLLGRLSPADSESFASALKSVGQFVTSNEVRDIAATVLPIAGAAAGTIIGGPVGTAIGGQIGGAAAQAVAPARRAQPVAAPAAPSRVAMPVAAAAPPATAGSAQNGSAAAAQLLTVVQNPAFLSSLLALVMGQNGRTSVPLSSGEKEVPVGAMVNLVKTLAERAADDAEELLTVSGEAMPNYLYDEEGCLTCDPAVSSQRADALLRVLAADAEGLLDGDAEGDVDEEWEQEDWDSDGGDSADSRDFDW